MTRVSDKIIPSDRQSNEMQYPSWSGDSWMRDVGECISDRCLTDIVLLGAHNSGTYNIKSKQPFGADAPELLTKSGAGPAVAKFFAKGPTARWSKCQSMTILEQLRFGVRYVDLRVVLHTDGEHYISHGQLSITLSDALGQIKDFVDLPEASEEIVIVDIQHIYGYADDAAVEKLLALLAPLRQYCFPNTTRITTTRLSRLRQITADDSPTSKPCQLVVCLGRAFNAVMFPHVFHRNALVQSEWKDKNTVTDLLACLTSDVGKGKSKEARGMLYVTQAILSPLPGNIAKSIVFIGPRTIKQYAKNANDKMLEWFWCWNACDTIGDHAVRHPPHVHRNILLLDFVEIGSHIVREDDSLNSIEVCVRANLARHQRRLFRGTREV